MGEHNSRAQIAETIHRVLGNFLLFYFVTRFEIKATLWLNQVKHDCFAKRFQSFSLCEMYVVVQIFPWFKIFQTSLIFTFLCLKSITIIRDKEKQKLNWFEKF